MNIEEIIKNFNKQFDYEPEIENGADLKKLDKFLVVGMGGSHLAADLLKSWKPHLDIATHNDYGLPNSYDAKLKDRLIILSSYSGNTEEVVDAFEIALAHKFPMAVITVGGKLLDLAIENKVPYIKLPEEKVQPRLSLGFSLRSLLKLIGDNDGLNISSTLSQFLKPSDWEAAGEALAVKIKDTVPIIYSSARNEAIAYNWKIIFNETGKVPAFCNIFPELNHNEAAGFDVSDATRGLSNKFSFIILNDSEDDPRIAKRISILENLFKERQLPFLNLEIAGSSRIHKIFNSIILAEWAAYYTAKGYGVASDNDSFIEEFKKLMRS